jgi:cell division protease FtsH
MVMQLPERDKLSMSREQMTSRLAIMMGGRVAEEMVFGKEKVTSGAASDIEQATKLARMMVTRWGCRTSSAPSPTARTRTRFSSATRSRASRTFLKRHLARSTVNPPPGRGGLCRATQILTEKRADLEVLAKGLLEFETLTGDEITDLLAGKRRCASRSSSRRRRALGGAAGRQAASAPRAADRRVAPQPQA